MTNLGTTSCFLYSLVSLYSGVIYPISAGMRIVQDFLAVLSVAELGQKPQFRIIELGYEPGSYVDPPMVSFYALNVTMSLPPARAHRGAA